MIRKKMLVSILAGMFAGTLLILGGCAAEEGPQALTGEEPREPFVQTRAGRIMPRPMAGLTPAADVEDQASAF